MFLHADTPQDRIERAVSRELVDLCERATRAINALALDNGSAPEGRAALNALERGRVEGFFPREELKNIAGSHHSPRLASELGTWIEKHERLERRLRWLLNPEVTRAALPTLDPREDCDQIWCFVKYEFRPEFLFCAWGNAIERIAQSEAVSNFFHSTGTAEETPVKRTEDTLLHYYYFFNWGLDSMHGRKAIEGMNQMHGRYFIHNDGMKYVLLNAAFTVIDALRTVGHRPLSEVERLGYFHAQINMGQAMNIRELTHSWDEMRLWFDTLSRANAEFAPQKLRMWNSLEDNFDRDAKVPKVVGQFRRTLEKIGMDDTYRSALGFKDPTDQEKARARKVVNWFTSLRESLPRGEPYIESLQNFFTYPKGVDIEAAGEKKRSARMPAACPFSGRTMEERNVEPITPPLLHASHAPDVELRMVTWEEVNGHRREGDLWVVFGGQVYDVSAFARNHPGGLKVLLNGAGRDMTKAFENAGHSDLTRTFALNYRIGRIEPGPPPAWKRPEAAPYADLQTH